MRHTGNIDSPLLKEQLAALARDKGGYEDARFSAAEIEALIDRQIDPDVERIAYCHECVRLTEDKVCTWWNFHVHDLKNYCMYGKKEGDPRTE